MGLFLRQSLPDIEMKRHGPRTPPETILGMARMSFFSLLLGAFFLFPLHGQRSVPPNVETGYVTSTDGVRLYYAKVGSGSEIAILPGRLFTFPDFQRLAKGRTLRHRRARAFAACFSRIWNGLRALAGISPERIINTMTHNELLQWVNSVRG